ncbi:hypothetical protein [Bdellovibrio sp. HCB337]|uniref:hypothetical protein n=1 Tax=Bdellovibrio sp. HCB337 TaxID=3394358 RepID=UPI0039A4301D
MDTALIKLKQLLSSRYGKGLELRRLMDLSKLRIDSEPVIQGNDLYIPIVVQEQFLGTAVIPHGWELCEDKKKSVTQLVRMVLEPKLYSEYLERRETNLQSLESTTFSTENVTIFGDDEDLNEDTIVEQKNLVTSLLHLQGHDNSLIKKVALQIHEFSTRWAFVPFEDVSKEIRSAMDICNLGGMTLFVENVEALSEEHQALLAEYVKSPRSLVEPLILTSSNLSFEKLSSRLVNQALVAEIKDSYLEVERAPLSSEMLRELLDLFFHKDENQDLH